MHNFSDGTDGILNNRSSKSMSLKGNTETLGLSTDLDYPGQVFLTCDDNAFIQDKDYAGLPKAVTRHKLKCDRTVQQPSELTDFDYSRFSMYLHYKKLDERHNRFYNLYHTVQTQTVESCLQHDNLLMEELFQLYGEMDTKAIRFKNIFESYKEERLSELKLWEDEEKELLKDCNKLTLKALAEREPLDFSKIFSQEELLQFNFHNQTISKVKPFNLPMKTPTVPNQNMTNLTEFDPEIHLPEFTVPDNSEAEIGEKLAQKFNHIVANHPFGIASVAFLMEFQEKYGYFPSHQQMGYSSFDELMSDLGKHLIHVDCSKRDFFMFPMCLKGSILSCKDMFYEIWHKCRICLYILCGICRTDVLLKNVTEIFGLKFHLDAWGFSTDEEFVMFLHKTWPIRGIQLISECDILKSGFDDKMYLIDVKSRGGSLLETLDINFSEPRNQDTKKTGNDPIFNKSCSSNRKKWNALF